MGEIDDDTIVVDPSKPSIPNTISVGEIRLASMPKGDTTVEDLNYLAYTVHELSTPTGSRLSFLKQVLI